jgi:methionine-rich copper-binding protein CopC
MNKKNIFAAIMLVAAGAAVSVAQAHAKIASTEPKADSELQSAPKEIRLQFNEALEGAFSKIELVDANEAAVQLPKAAVDKSDPKVMFTAVPALQPGQYSVRWSTMTHDGHKAKGQFSFKVK